MPIQPAPHRRSARGRKVRWRPPLSIRRPDLARDWHPTKNGLLTLDQCAANSTHQVWWQCHQNPHHVWRASVKSRYCKRSGCRRCALAMRARNHVAFRVRTLRRKSPELAAAWHPTRNGTLTPDDVTYHSRQRVWWQCPSNPHHVWDTTVNNRQRSNCPFCAGRFHRAIDARHRWHDPISVTHPHLVPEWHPTRNGRIRPNQVTAGSKRLVWWQCPLKASHAWQTPVHCRTLTRRSCPFCRTERRRMLTLKREQNPQLRKSRFLRLRPRLPANPVLPFGARDEEH